MKGPWALKMTLDPGDIVGCASLELAQEMVNAAWLFLLLIRDSGKGVIWSWLTLSSVLQGKSKDTFLNRKEPLISVGGLACLHTPLVGPTGDPSPSSDLFCPVPHAGPSVHFRPGEEQGVVLAVGTGGAVDGTRPYHLTAAWPLVGRAPQGGAEL